AHETPARATPSRGSHARAKVADFCAAAWPVFTPPLTVPFLESREITHFVRVEPDEWDKALAVLEEGKPA
ncbi:MAG: hypothetical protein O9309_17750, partial [Rhizobium sp.]|nr:hypothetical protein [Rhizobium sp.]